MTARRRFTIIWDFDGTLLPLDPWDSEQELLLSRLDGLPRLSWRRLYGRLAVEADRRGWLLSSFKRRYLALLRGTPRDFLDQVAATLARRIAEPDREAVRRLQERGHHQLVASCGTADLSERILALCGLRSCFAELFGNSFVFQRGRIAGMRLEVTSGRAKLELVQSLGITPGEAVAVGDGATDRPLWEWSAVPVAVGPGARAPAAGLSCRRVASPAGVLELVRRLGG
jgi:phosphoserine phosphatase